MDSNILEEYLLLKHVILMQLEMLLVLMVKEDYEIQLGV